ncbi:AaceriAFR075Cp [[Ashbya] aceris (nom. inval.)]|nr:AaceriAFR075Cp [[Ashbya] aceris (nom. inval.)]
MGKNKKQAVEGEQGRRGSASSGSSAEPTGAAAELPSFKKTAGGGRSGLIEQDAVDTIREQTAVKFADEDVLAEDELPGPEDAAEAQKTEAVASESSSLADKDEEHDESKLDHFRNFFRRTSSRSSAESDGGGMMERFINMTGGGMVPVVTEAPVEDEEAGTDPVAEAEAAAREIMKAHHLSSGQSTVDLMSMSSSGGESGFFMPGVDHYDDEYNPEHEEEQRDDLSEATYVPPPQHVRGGVLGSLLRMYQNQPGGQAPQHPGMRKSAMSSETLPTGEGYEMPKFKAKRPRGSKIPNPIKLKRKSAMSEARITVHIADLLQRHRFILRLCKAFMMYGAPTHRLEEYMVMTSRVLEIDGQFLYLPGCMVVSFGDTITRTSDVQLVRCAQGLNLWKLHQVHSIYKQVVHDIISVEDASRTIETIMSEKNLYPAWMCVLLYGFCASMVTPFAFGGDWINLVVSFGVGSCVGLLQFIVAQRSHVYSNVFEITASIVVSFCARALGSIPNSNICFGSTVQGSLALILPGYIILCGSLELQSRSLVAGSVRMFYAIIYSLFLGFGITLGAALFGWIYHGATNETVCEKDLSPWFRFIFVPAFSLGLSLINQARWSQIPVMVVIACSGYVVTYWSGQHFTASTEFTASLGAFVIGIMGNLYSRIWKGLAMTAMLPGIFVQVPSGIASKSTLLSSVQSANNMVNNGTNVAMENMDGRTSISFGITMVQVCIGISVGLFASTLVVYPFGKKRTGLFTL